MKGKKSSNKAQKGHGGEWILSKGMKMDEKDYDIGFKKRIGRKGWEVEIQKQV